MVRHLFANRVAFVACIPPQGMPTEKLTEYLQSLVLRGPSEACSYNDLGV